MSDEDIAWGIRTFGMLRADSHMTSKLDPALLGRLHRHFIDRPLADIPDLIAGILAND